ncbi:TetR/AcrR family transcriptional regulator [Polycladidibacter stylochi]|uniref:TetR/AcrR family transcriptional regulator n=1 Tax=Polycladidibacter stylochi TaxID=1807766 RepID=UPI00082C54C8|nr:TetR/AcrR family transcriptional regulator [Pseudovibrio stylochi]
MSTAEVLTAQGRAKDVLRAAKAIFLHKGYKASSIAEIAETSGISMAHIYNFYKNKMELACAVVSAEYAMLVARLEASADPNASASIRLTNYLLMIFDETARLQREYSGLMSCLELVKNKRPHLHVAHEVMLRQPLIVLIDSGKLSDEFKLQASELWAQALLDATEQFRFTPIQTHEEMVAYRARLKTVIQLCLKGLER